MRRNLTWLVVGVILVSLIAATALLAVRAQSPDEAAANAAAPPHSLVAAEAQNRLLSRSIRTSCEAASKKDLAVPVPETADPVVVVTGVPQGSGATVQGGFAIVETNGRPQIAWATEFGLWRDLVGGVTGRDVAAVADALVARGLLDRPTDRYDSTMARAVGELYEQAGYDPPPVPGDAVARVDVARHAVEAALGQLDAANAGGATEVAAAAYTSLQAARRDLSSAQAGAIVPLPRSEFVALPQGDLYVSSPTLNVGDVFTATSIRLSTRELGVTCTLPLTAEAIPDGSLVELRSSTGSILTGRCAGVRELEATIKAESSGDPQVQSDGAQKRLVVELAAPPEPGALAPSEELVASIVVATSAEPVLAVPLAAIRGTDSNTVLEVLSSDGSRSQVSVTLGMVADGYAEIRNAPFTAGTQVVVSG